MPRITNTAWGVLISSILFSSPMFADSTSSGNSYVTVTNNTADTIQIATTLDTTDKAFSRSKDWDGISDTLAPYETKQVLWFSRNNDVKANQQYQFNVVATHDEQTDPTIITFDEKGQSVYGSELKVSLTLPKMDKQTILKQSGLEQFKDNFWGKDYIIYARSWLPSGSNFNDFQIVIDRPENNVFDTTSNQTLSVLTYNTQMMPFYANVVDDLNQPQIRVTDIPPKITQYDVVIMEELFDHDLRYAMIDGMKAAYPFHTQSISDDKTSKVLSGGVLIFSKWPITIEKEIVYQASAGADSLSAKGAVYAAINKNGKIYHIVGTHLQAGGDDDEKQARQQQLSELTHFMDSLNVPSNEPLLIGGDLNTNEFGGDIDNLLATLHVNLFANVGYKYSYDGYVDTMAVNQHHSRIDYVFYSNTHLLPKVALNKVYILRDLDNETMWPKFDLSDHFPTGAYFDFSERETTN